MNFIDPRDLDIIPGITFEIKVSTRNLEARVRTVPEETDANQLRVRCNRFGFGSCDLGDLGDRQTEGKRRERKKQNKGKTKWDAVTKGRVRVPRAIKRVTARRPEAVLQRR